MKKTVQEANATTLRLEKEIEKLKAVQAREIAAANKHRERLEKKIATQELKENKKPLTDSR
jgi:hypothetical protein